MPYTNDHAMTDDELRALIAECEDPDHEQSYICMPDLAPLLRDALRFRHMIATAYSNYGTTDFLGNGDWRLSWNSKKQPTEPVHIRAAIDADMEGKG